MRNDRGTKVLLAVIALGVWALIIVQAGIPVADAESGSQRLADQFPAKQGASRTPGPATLPLRWHVDYVAEANAIENTYCVTSVVVRNVTSTAVEAQVEWFVWDGSSKGYTQVTLQPGRMRVVTSNNDISARPFSGLSAEMSGFVGHANVHADDPRVHASAYFTCRDATGTSANLVAMMPIGTSPVGTTMEYFQAGMPATWAPPMVEVPE